MSTEGSGELPGEPLPRRYLTDSVIDALCQTLHLPFDIDMQDWPMEVSDDRRLPEFLDLYEAGGHESDFQFVLMALIVFSLEDLLLNPGFSSEQSGKVERRVETLLRRDFTLHLHTIDYWRCAEDEEHPDPEWPDNYFAPAPMMRRVWHDCLRPKHEQWLDNPAAPPET